jgi:hypothetical protein
MSYSGLIRRFLISCPGDVPTGDLAIVRQSISRWNGIYGEGYATAIVPIWWGEHAAAEFGQHPQSVINKQLVDRVDCGIALFFNRIGTATNKAASGTAEEIEELAESGRYVAILRCRRRVDPARIDHAQAVELEEYLAKIRQRALILEYSTDVELASYTDNIITRVVTRDEARAEMQLQAVEAQSSALIPPTPSKVAEVWPRVESSESIGTDSRGRIRTSRNWRLVLHNTGTAPARNVRFRTDDASDSWGIFRDVEGGDPDVAILAPGGEAAFIIAATMGSVPTVLCTVTWVDDRGTQMNSATLRLT